MDVVVVEGLSGGELLDHVTDLAATQRRCEVEILRAAVQHAYLHHPGSLDPDEADKPGRERARRMGGAGTPEVTEFAAAELGARLGISTVSAGLLMADGLDIRHRLPQLWRRVEAGEVRVYLARLVARKTRDLTPEQAAYVDSRVAHYADGRLTWTRFQALVDGAVAAADPEATAERERRAAEQQVARPTRAEDDDHGMRGFYIRAPPRSSRSSTPPSTGWPSTSPTTETTTPSRTAESKPSSCCADPTPPRPKSRSTGTRSCHGS